MLTDTEVISALGGPKSLSEALRLGRSAATNWGKRGIPAEHRIAVWQMALDAGLDWTPPGADSLRAKLCALPQAKPEAA